MNFKALALAATVALGGMAIAPEAKAFYDPQTSADHWVQSYSGHLSHAVSKSCGQGYNMNARGVSYYQMVHQLTVENAQRYPEDAQIEYAQTAGKNMVMRRVCPSVW